MRLISSKQSAAKHKSELDESVIYSDCRKAYDGLVDYAALAHYRVKHSKNEFVNGKNHINSIENFWGYAKHRLSKFKEIFSSVATVATARKLSKENFLLHLKECVLLYFTVFVAFQDAATSEAK